jgi:uncharacterized membrane protein YeaQ/YmgE (transglycosylase-associated protein family)
MLELLLLLLIAGICGALGQSIAGYSRGGCLAAIALGFIGALIGQWIAESLGLPAVFVLHVDGQPFPVVWAILGAALFVAVLSLFTSRRAAK